MGYHLFMRGGDTYTLNSPMAMPLFRDKIMIKTDNHFFTSIFTMGLFVMQNALSFFPLRKQFFS